MGAYCDNILDVMATAAAWLATSGGILATCGETLAT
jgi:hypothetical protein